MHYQTVGQVVQGWSDDGSIAVGGGDSVGDGVSQMLCRTLVNACCLAVTHDTIANRLAVLSVQGAQREVVDDGCRNFVRQSVMLSVTIVAGRLHSLHETKRSASARKLMPQETLAPTVMTDGAFDGVRGGCERLVCSGGDE